MTFITKLFFGLAVAETCSAQTWQASHFGGYPVATVDSSYVAELPMPHPGSPIRIVSTFTTTNTPALLGDLTGKTLSATVWLECSNCPEFYSGATGCGADPITMRLFITSDQRPYTEVHGLQNPSAYWWCYATNGWSSFTCGTNVLRCTFTPDGWSDALGHLASDPNYTPAFMDCAKNIAQDGLSFGCRFYENGVGIWNDDTSATLHVLAYDATCPSVMTLQIVSSGSTDGPWNPVGPPMLVTNPPSPTFFKVTIGSQ